MMQRLVFIALFSLMLSACSSWDPAEPPPPEALSGVSCDTGGRHGPSGVMDWRCTDGDGVERLPVRSLHEVIDGEGNDREQRREARRDRLGRSHGDGGAHRR